MRIRPEQPTDASAIFAVQRAAFPSDAEARLVEALRRSGRLRLSLVAEMDGAIVGHVAFSPVRLQPAHAAAGLGLAPVAVMPPQQRRGVGAALIREGLRRCAGLGASFVVVLGDPAYYRRFGFEPAHLRGIGNEYGARDEFMIVEQVPGSLPAGGALARYCEEFALVS